MKLSSLALLPGLAYAFLQLDFTAKKLESSVAPSLTQSRLARRENSPIPLANDIGVPKWNSYYVADVKLGNPGSSIQLALDTGSSDLWVYGQKSHNSEGYGWFDWSKSSTFKNLTHGFLISYQEGPNGITALGLFGEDTLRIGPYTLDNATVAVVANSNSPIGVLGISFIELEAGYEYDNLPVLLAKQGYISSPVYSIYLNTKDASSGSVLFGAIDQAKYEGELTTIPMDTTLPQTAINLKSIDVVIASGKAGKKRALETRDGQNSGSIDTNNVPAVFDTGTAYFLLTQDLATEVISKIDPNAPFDPWAQGYVIDGSFNKEENYLKFDFGAASINVPFTDCIFNNGTDADPVYIFSITPYGANVVGDALLRQIYLVFDLEKKTIAFANVKNTDDTHIVEI